MDVILLERIEKLGQMGDLVSVRRGFARNFLLPQKKAVVATEQNKKEFESQRALLESQNHELKTEADKIGKKLGGTQVIIVQQAGDAGQLYGAVTARDISNGVTEAGFAINRSQVKLESPIKAVGVYNVEIILHPEVSVLIAVNVARSNEEATIQEKTGLAVANEDEKPSAVDELVEKLDAEELNTGTAGTESSQNLDSNNEETDETQIVKTSEQNVEIKTDTPA